VKAVNDQLPIAKPRVRKMEKIDALTAVLMGVPEGNSQKPVIAVMYARTSLVRPWLTRAETRQAKAHSPITRAETETRVQTILSTSWVISVWLDLVDSTIDFMASSFWLRLRS
jgi:hypothetical protein